MMNLPTKHLPAEERRAVTVEAVIALAAEQNPGDITTAAIARHMKVTQGALFRHFPSKEAIWQAVMEWVAERLLARLERAAQGARGAHAMLEAIFLAHIAFVAEYPGVPRMLFGELQRAEPSPAKRMAQTLLQRYGKRLRGIIEAGQRQGELSAEVDSAAAATLFIGMIQGLVMQSMLAGDLARLRNDAPGVFRVYWQGLRSISS
jgi:AcrR family transcriptional regulator